MWTTACGEKPAAGTPPSPRISAGSWGCLLPSMPPIPPGRKRARRSGPGSCGTAFSSSTSGAPAAGWPPPTPPMTRPRLCCSGWPGVPVCGGPAAFFRCGETLCGPFSGPSGARSRNTAAGPGFPFVTDETNLSPRYARNRLRSQALPALRSANAGAVRNMAAWCEEMRQLEEYLAAQADTLLTQARRGQGWQASVLLAAPQPVGDRALAALCASRAQPDREKIAWLRQLAAGKLRAVQLGKNARLARSHGLLVWESEVSVPAQEPVIPLSTGIFALNEEYSVKIWCETYENGTNFLQVHKKALNYCADCDKIPSDTVLRVMQPGDRFRPRGRGVSKPLRKFYWEQGIPAAQRPFLPVLASGSRVLWVWGYGFADGLSGASAACRLWAGPHVTQEQEDNHECECEYGAGYPAHAVE